MGEEKGYMCSIALAKKRVGSRHDVLCVMSCVRAFAKKMLI